MRAAFSDIETHWARPCIEALARENLVNGYGDRTFRPDNRLTRTEFAVLLCRAFPEAPVTKPGIRFRDIPQAYWGFKDIHAAAERGFFSGYPDGSFQPHRQIPRVEAAVAIASHLQLHHSGDVTATLQRWFEDSHTVPDYAREKIAAMARDGLLVGYPNPQYFDGDRPLTRAEAAAWLCRVLQLDAVPLEYVVGVETPPKVRSLAGSWEDVPLIYARGTWDGGNGGIWVSTLSGEGKLNPEAHSDRSLSGHFRVLTQVRLTPGMKIPYQGILIYNPSESPVTVKVNAAASYADYPDAPWRELREIEPNPDGSVFSGAESRVMDTILRRKRGDFPEQVQLESGAMQVLLNAPILADEAGNQRLTLLDLWSSGAVRLASLVMEATEPPTLTQWLSELQGGENLADEVAVRSQSLWRSQATNGSGDDSPLLTVPTPGATVCLPIDSGPGLMASVAVSLYNDLTEAVSVAVSLSSPASLSEVGVTFSPGDEVAWLTPVRLGYRDYAGTQLSSMLMVTRRQGEMGSPLVVLRIAPGSSRNIALQWISGMKAILPYVLTVKTL